MRVKRCVMPFPIVYLHGLHKPQGFPFIGVKQNHVSSIISRQPICINSAIVSSFVKCIIG